MTELRIFKLLVKYVNDPFAAAQFVNILLPIFKKKALNSGEDAPIMRLRSRTSLNLYSSQYLNSFYLPRLLLQHIFLLLGWKESDLLLLFQHQSLDFYFLFLLLQTNVWKVYIS